MLKARCSGSAALRYASETEGLAFAAANPLDRSHMVLVLAGNNALAMVRMLQAGFPRAEYAIVDSGEQNSSGFLK